MHRMLVGIRPTSGLLAGVLALGAMSAAEAQGLSAIVESITPPRADVRAFDLLAEGTVIELAAGEVLALGYMNSCAREEITGGRVTIGAAESMVDGGKVKRALLPCGTSVDPDSMDGVNEAAVVAIRTLGGGSDPKVRVVPSLQPIFIVSNGAAPADPSLVIQRLDRPESPIRVSLFGAALDLRQTGMKLTPGGIYSAACGGHTVAFKIADNAGVAPVAMLQRLVRF